jgi:uncharacterized membrane protein YphA (DoxX/SURF4 family)
MSPYYKIGRLAVWSIVLLRLAVGWHFFMEGQAKVHEGNFTSKAFLSAAKGPLAPLYHQAIWDYDGTIRLDKAKMTELLKSYETAAKDYYTFSGTQVEDAEKLTKGAIGQVEDVFDQWDEDIFKFNQGRERVAQMNRDPTRLFVASLRAQKEKIETDRLASVKPALSTIDKIVVAHQAKVNSLATDEQKKSKDGKGEVAPIAVERPGSSIFQSDSVDKIIPIFDMAIGICLMIGLLTRVASLAAAGFLFSVVLSQFPGFSGTAPTYFQAVEALACVVLFSTDAGRFAGLDFIPWSVWQVAGQGKAAAARG